MTRVRNATADDAAVLFEFNKNLFIDEGLGDIVTATAEQYCQQIFEHHQAEAIIVSDEKDSRSKSAGMGLFYPDYSSVSGYRGMHLKSLYVKPEFRRKGYAHIIMSELARIALERGWRHINWLCLEDNLPAMKFYDSIGAELVDVAVSYQLPSDKVTAMLPPQDERSEAGFAKRWEGLRFRKATARDVTKLHGLVMDLARHEGIEDWEKVTPANMRDQIFERGGAEAVLAECGGAVAGMVIYYSCYNTFTGKPGLYLEDIFIKPEFRNRGYGHAFFEKLALICNERGWGHIEWLCLEDNSLARGFYSAIGSDVFESAKLFNLEGEALSAAADSLR